ncbi:acyl-CoA synthetase/AMP-acid ligase-like protein II [Pseudovirgaria hyperparasitica]|uniref:Acyl-CoA synthetase/AMP-acid ligase-like protein II n=1 Tax=Pseudovirgaria hyperparasitica TaxID=470096 RepID=A0A6A6W9M8_9PEZI|nr:acyl-CoA synthetase/AMP-acid ligase-like protein II [Pseudovirgaria hyperparasitica]KAF2758297.1 acyl-CoA synthetase/AMP-acid ligase-like protein II [Pseudovirgaria hyperparasitica]
MIRISPRTLLRECKTGVEPIAISGVSRHIVRLSNRGLLTRAHTVGPSEPPLLEQTISENFADIVSRHGDRPAVHSRHQQKTLSYADLDRQSSEIARGLVKRGIKKGDRVAVFLGNNIEFAVITYSLYKLGAILVPLNPAFNVTQVIAALTHLSATQLVVGLETNLPRKEPRSNIPMLQQMIPGITSSRLESELVPSLKSVVFVDNSQGRIDTDKFRSLTPWGQVEEDGGRYDVLLTSELDPSETVNIQFTSGTTSTPKAACLSHRNILNNGKAIGDRMLLTEKDVVCCPPPLFHCFGSVLGYQATATHGSSIVFPTEAFDPLATLRSVQEYRATALYGVPTMFTACLELLADGTILHEGFQYLRTGIAAGSPVPSELMKKLHMVLNLTDLTICYGMTETSPVSCQTTTDDPLERRIDSVGRPLSHVEAKIVDPSDWSKTLGVDERGELAVSGYNVMGGYWRDDIRTKEVLVPDEMGKMWMHTGDEASMSPDGYVRITGRIKDIIIRGGENIHPLEIENCLFAHPSISEVSVVGMPDEHYGEAVAAFIVPNSRSSEALHASDREGKDPTAEEVRTWVRERLSHHLVPKYVFWAEDFGEFPKTPSGKIQKYKLRDQGIGLIKSMAKSV